MANKPIAWWTQEIARILRDAREPDGHPNVINVVDSVVLNRLYVGVHDDEGERLLTLEVNEG